ncbi:NAD(P)/FAD-dependent oxidoreductase [Winogradskyella immobilis]|uniref:FAD-binding oxidoreductase n=1 Tax=Winogradskyella immobilis TaxID=2816852 RepID=A0ABS8EMC4_9FLAO|nr:FAD-binding oxidoreductase [Winogradskyella immobilis]MCC1484012.1 FAD-binding oxidoreductase [Winogradskyella immobilis]MCG0016104.1 FAD-binding oxidoreductase [Winogradskyella immobilis]
MKSVDYIIVGCGLASIAFCETLKTNNKTFVVYDDASQQSSIVAAGLYNPVILKRFSEVWKAKEQLELALPMYAKIEIDLNIKLDYKLKLLRRFNSIEEQNQWLVASDKLTLEPYLSTEFIKNRNPNINTDFDFGEVLHAGRIDTKTLILEYKLSLQENEQLESEHFQYDELKINSDEINYGDYKAKHIVFAEGFGIKKNPFFKELPLNGTKGEVITIKAPDLKIDYAVKSSVFIIPMSDDLYKVGATYEWNDKTNTPTEEGKAELIKKLKIVITCDFKVVEHKAGIRPTVKDRRPLVGRHTTYKNMYVLNGLGTRGVMIAPYVAKKLYNYIENSVVLDKEIDISRFG